MMVAKYSLKHVSWGIVVARMRIVTAIALLVIGAVTPAQAGDAQDCTNIWIDPDQTIAACVRLAEVGESWAQFNLGYYYFLGFGVPKNHEKAVEWYRRAADQGLWQAQNNLAIMYMSGQGVAHDRIQAYMWLTIAAQSRSGEEYISTMRLREIVEKRMTPSQIEEAQRLTEDWKPKAEDP